MKSDSFYPLVSILIPLYNAEKYIANTLESALGQTWPNKEIIVVNDGSSDNSLEVAKAFEKRGIVVLSRVNQGASVARNVALKYAKGDFIQFLDADDLLSPDKIEVQVQLLRQHPGKIAVCKTVHFFDGEDHLSKPFNSYETSFLFDTDDPVEFLINLYGGNGKGASMVQPNAWLTPRSVIERAGPWNEFRSPDDDGEYFCRALLASNGVRVANQGLNYYRKFKNGGSLSTHYSYQAVQNILLSYQSKQQNLLKRTSDIRAKKALGQMYLGFAVKNYCHYRELAEAALRAIQQLNVKPEVPRMGGRALEIIKKAFGWKTAARMSYAFRKVIWWLNKTSLKTK